MPRLVCLREVASRSAGSELGEFCACPVESKPQEANSVSSVRAQYRAKCVITYYRLNGCVFALIDCCLYTRPKDKGPRDMFFWDDPFMNGNFLVTS